MSDIVNKHKLTENFNNIVKKSIFGLDNINQFGKLEQIDDRFYNSDEDKYVLEYTPLPKIKSAIPSTQAEFVVDTLYAIVVASKKSSCP